MRLRCALLFLTGMMLQACSGGNFKGGSSQAEAPASGISGSETSNAIPSDGSPSPIPSADQVAALKEKCQKAPENSLKLFEQAITYPERKTCEFGAKGNLERLNGFVQAAEISPTNLNLPAGDICSILIDSPASARLRYDDFIILTIDSRIVFMSNKGLSKFLEAPLQGVLSWDFKSVIGKKIENFEAEPYCIGKGADCVLPSHDKEGPVALHLKTEEIAPIAAAISGKSMVPMNLTATGDNDDTDCYHTALDITVKIKYLP